ncbi:MAG: cytochrome c3 family protein [Pyrinomonadaceae bacterium]
MCAICHTNLESGVPPVKSFPALKSFNARFDHAQHTTGTARPQAGCVSCHTPTRRGIALSIPAGLGAHSNCYACHTPGAQSAGRDISSCATCHASGRQTRTQTNAKAYAVNFSHAAHGSRANLNCADCHTVKAGLSQSRQVAAPRPTQHFAPSRAQSCATCHDNRRAFGGEDFADCKRCHRAATFSF